MWYSVGQKPSLSSVLQSHLQPVFTANQPGYSPIKWSMNAVLADKLYPYPSYLPTSAISPHLSVKVVPQCMHNIFKHIVSAACQFGIKFTSDVAGNFTRSAVSEKILMLLTSVEVVRHMGEKLNNFKSLTGRYSGDRTSVSCRDSLRRRTTNQMCFMFA